MTELKIIMGQPDVLTFLNKVLNLVQIKGIKFCFKVFFSYYIKKKKQNMNGISLKLVPECNFVTKS